MIFLIHGKGNHFLICDIKFKWKFPSHLLHIHLIIYLLFTFTLISVTSIADQNDKWATYAGPGGWNGTFCSQFRLYRYLLDRPRNAMLYCCTVVCFTLRVLINS
jgi:hypothetical protein